MSRGGHAPVFRRQRGADSVADLSGLSGHDYSPRNDCIGSMEAARCAGIAEAARVSKKTAITARISTGPSNGLTPNRKERRRPEAAVAAAKPITQPMMASFVPETGIKRMIPERCEPNAIRIAISCTRDATEKAVTLYMPSAASNTAARASC